MTTSTGNSLQKTSSVATEAWTASLAVGLGVCLVAGAAIALTDIYLSIPLHMPGWRGIISMALLVLARRLSGRTWGATGAAIVAAGASLYAGEALRHGPFVYLLPGLIIDTLCLVVARWQNRALFLGLAAALANVSKFAVALLGVAALSHASEARGLLLPMASHLGFGLCGGLIAAALSFRVGRERSQTI